MISCGRGLGFVRLYPYKYARSNEPFSRELKHLANSVDREISGGILPDLFLIKCIVALSRENRRNSISPLTLQRVEYSELVVDHDITASGVKALYIVQ